MASSKPTAYSDPTTMAPHDDELQEEEDVESRVVKVGSLVEEEEGEHVQRAHEEIEAKHPQRAGD